EQRAGDAENADGGCEERLDPDGGELGVHARPVLAPEPRDLGLLAIVGLDELDGAEALLDDRAQGAAAPALLPGRLLDAARETARGDERDRRDDDGDERKLPAQVEERSGEDHDLEGVRDRAGDPRENERLDRGDVARQPRE